MTEITDQDRRAARAWAKNWQGDQDDDTSAAARVILATVDAPAPTLAERLQYRADLLDNGDPDGDTPQALRDLAARAAQMEQDLTEARAEVERERDLGVALAHERDEVRDELERLKRDLTEAYKTRDARDDEVDRLRAEVERLTAVNENLRRTDNYRQFREKFLTVQKQLADVQKGAESNAESLDPADVPAGEAWLVEFYGEKRNAVKDGDDSTPWNTANTGGRLSCVRNEDVTLIARLVPAPCVITNADELDRLPHNSVILSADNDAWQKSSETSLWASAWWATINGEPSIWSSRRLCDEDHPATVLWEPEA